VIAGLENQGYAQALQAAQQQEPPHERHAAPQAHHPPWRLRPWPSLQRRCRASR
jgi:hypothetical protein